jgi:hypothetical protein
VRTVVVVGHGPSLKGAGLGSEIDKHFVVRLKNCHMLLAEPKDYGKKTSAMCSSTEVLPTLTKIHAPEYWGYPKKGDYSPRRVKWLKNHVDRHSKVFVPLDVCNEWNQKFCEIGGRHPNLSTGMGAVVIALDRLKPGRVLLAGFDNVINPGVEGYKSTVPTPFNAGGTKDTGHDWLTEHKMLPLLANHYKARIEDLAGRYVVSPE